MTLCLAEERILPLNESAVHGRQAHSSICRTVTPERRFWESSECTAAFRSCLISPNPPSVAHLFLRCVASLIISARGFQLSIQTSEASGFQLRCKSFVRHV